MAKQILSRQEFLENHWLQYPAAKSDWCDVEQMLARRASGWVGGRLVVLNPSGGIIESAGARLEFTFAENIRWQDSGLRHPCDFRASQLALGDVICIEVDHARERRALTLLLLTPALAPTPTFGKFSIERSQQWARFVRTVREFFEQRAFIEAVTPTLVISPGTEPYLQSFSTLWQLGERKEVCYLPTSPEFSLKKMLAAGWTRLFEIKTCFRNGEIGEHHQPEFAMLEWYRAYANLDAIADDVEELIAAVATTFTEDLPPRLQRTTMAQLFLQAFDGFVLRPNTSLAELSQLAKQAGIATQTDDTWDEVFFRLFLTKIEASLGADGPLLVRGYPPSQAALSRIGEDGFADRFEVYWHGLELANAFHELNDPTQNSARFADDAKEKRRLNFPAVPIDEKLLDALRAGLPPSGGIALGLERLFMALTGVKRIDEVRAFPILG